MRILLIIIMILAMLVATGMGLAIFNNNILSDEAAAAAKLLESLGDSEQAQKLGGYRTSGYGGLVLGLLALVMVVVTFMKKTKVIQIVAGLTALFGVVFIAMSPGFETGEYAAASPQKQAMIYCIAAMVVALCGFGAEKMRLNKAS